jgi:hypothetical protein
MLISIGNRRSSSSIKRQAGLNSKYSFSFYLLWSFPFASSLPLKPTSSNNFPPSLSSKATGLPFYSTSQQQPSSASAAFKSHSQLYSPTIPASSLSTMTTCSLIYGWSVILITLGPFKIPLPCITQNKGSTSSRILASTIPLWPVRRDWPKVNAKLLQGLASQEV